VDTEHNFQDSIVPDISNAGFNTQNLDFTDMKNFTPIPEGKMPLFGDCFDGLPIKEKE
jgi:hypothetical protein